MMTTSPTAMNRWFGVIAFVLVVATFLPLLMRGTDAYVTIHDNLDSEVTYPGVLHASGHAYTTDPEARIPQVMDGIPRAFYRSGFNLTVVLFGLLPAFHAYWLGGLLAHLAGLFGMRWLLKRHLMRGTDQEWVIWTISFCFAIIPFYSIYGLFITAQPFLLLAFLSFRDGTWRWWDVLIVLIFPFTVLNYMITPFALVILGGIAIHQLWVSRKFNAMYWTMMTVLVGLMVVVEWGLLRAMFSGAVAVSHRTEWRVQSFYTPDVASIASKTISLFLHGQYHSGLFYSVPILLCAVVAAIAMRDRTRTRMTVLLVAGIMLCMVLFRLYMVLLERYGDTTPLLRVFTWNRFFLLTPLMWILVLAVAANGLARARWGRILFAVACILHSHYALRNNAELVNNVKLLAGGRSEGPSFTEFYSPSLFAAMKGRQLTGPMEDYRVACVGFPPNVAQFNGLFTLDSYQNNYDLAYKHRFREVIRTELDKSDELRDYFDNWGSRCYMWSAELGKRYDLYRGNQVTLQRTSYDLDAFRALGGTHIISAVVLSGPLADRLSLTGEFQDDHSAWHLRLYEVKP